MNIFANAFGVTYLNLAMTAIASVVHWTLVYFITDMFDNKMIPIAIASSVQFTVRCIVVWLGIRGNEEMKKGLIPLSDPQSWEDLKEMRQLGFDSVLLKVMGWWAFDIFTQLASFLTVSDLGGQTILRNIGLFTYMIPVGLAVSANVLTGKYIGKNKSDLAHRISGQIMFVTFIWSICQMAIVYFGETFIIDFYTTDEDVKKAILPAWYVLVFFVFFDCMQGVSNGLISGLGLMSDVKWVTTVAYWVVGIPVSYFLMFEKNMDLEGLWYGPTLACLINYLYYTAKT
jgi:MATE family multidrug resistance protein